MRAREVDHPDPAGDQGRAARGAGQQRTDLGGVAGVVQEDEDAAAGQGGAVQRRAFVQRVRDRRVRGAEGPQERAQYGVRFGRATACALQVDVELAVREVRAGLVGDMDRERRLSDAADARERRHRHDRALGGGEPVAELPDEGGPPGEVGHGRGQLGRKSHLRCRFLLLAGPGQFGVGLEDALLEPGEFGPRIDAQFLGEQPAGVRVHGQRLGLPSAAVQRQHQQLAQPLPQRVGRGERRQLRDRLGMTAHLQVQVEPGLQQLEAPFLQAGALVLGVRPRHVGQRLAVPQSEGLVDQHPGLAAVAGGTRLLRLGGQFLGHGEVEGLGPDPYGIAAGLADERVGAEDLAQPGGVRADGGERL